MAEKFVAKTTEMQDGDRRIVFVGDHEIGVFRHEGQFYAYSNFCLHQGGPACEGLTIAKVEERLRPDKTSQGLYFSETEMHFARISRRRREWRELQGSAEGRRDLCRRVRRQRPRLVPLRAPSRSR